MPTADEMLMAAKKAFIAGEMAAARDLCLSVIDTAPGLAGPWIILSDVGLKSRRADTALRCAGKAVALEPRNPFAYLVCVKALMASSKLKEAIRTAEEAVAIDDCPVGVLESLALIFTQLGQHARALDILKIVVSQEPRNAGFVHNLAAAERTFGALEDAERHCDEAIALNKHLYESYFIRADLRKQTKERNHTTQMEALIADGIGDQNGEILVRFALGKEYEDLGEFAQAFRHIKAGADLKRRRLRYEIKGNIAVIARTIRAHSRQTLDGIASRLNVSRLTRDDPIFIVGLPRSGTTLVERIIAGHSCVVAAGELGTLPSELIRAAINAGLKGGGDWVEQLERIDLHTMGHEYSRVARETGIPDGRRFIDKLPSNFLYCSAARLAIPNAKIITLRRGPMDSCFALYKALFAKAAYRYSYDLDELAQYYAAFRRLIDHWKTALSPDFFLEVSYENIVADLEGQSRRIIHFLGLSWEDEVLRFHESRNPSTTLSAVQVRQPIYASSVGKWRNYAVELEPLRARLAELMPGEDLG